VIKFFMFYRINGLDAAAARGGQLKQGGGGELAWRSKRSPLIA